jgi:diacylglycerol kinase family enzyme
MPVPPAINAAGRLYFIVNQASGSEAVDEGRAAIEVALLPSGRAHEFRICAPDDLAQAAKDAAQRAASEGGVVVAVGGDGTLNTVAQAAHAAGCVMGVVPRGTFNYFARSHGISSDGGEAVQQLLGAQPQAVRVAALNDRLFLVNASLGLYPELLEDREYYKARFGRSRWVAVVAGITTLLRAQRRLRLQIERSGSTREVRALTIFVGHNRLQLAQWGVQGEPEQRRAESAAAQGTDLTAVMLRPIGTVALLGLLWHGAMGTLSESESVERFTFDHLVVRPSRLYRARRVKVAFDGEVAWMPPPLQFRVLEQPLWLLKPAPDSTSAVNTTAEPGDAAAGGA